MPGKEEEEEEVLAAAAGVADREARFSRNSLKNASPEQLYRSGTSNYKQFQVTLWSLGLPNGKFSLFFPSLRLPSFGFLSLGDG